MTRSTYQQSKLVMQPNLEDFKPYSGQQVIRHIQALRQSKLATQQCCTFQARILLFKNLELTDCNLVKSKPQHDVHITKPDNSSSRNLPNQKSYLIILISAVRFFRFCDDLIDLINGVSFQMVDCQAFSEANLAIPAACAPTSDRRARLSAKSLNFLGAAGASDQNEFSWQKLMWQKRSTDCSSCSSQCWSQAVVLGPVCK